MDLVRDKMVSEIVARLSQARGPVQVEGTWGSFARLLTSHISKSLRRPVLHLCAHIDDADRAFDDLKTFGVERIELLPAWEGEEELADATDETRAQRLRLVSLLADSGSGGERVAGILPAKRGRDALDTGLVIAAPVQALCQPIPKPSALQESALQVKRDGVVDPEHVIEWLVKNNFERVDALDLPGQFARRGGIIDIYAPLAISSTGILPVSSMGVPPMSTRGILPLSCHGQDAHDTHGRDGRATHGRDAPATEPQSRAVRIEFFGDTVESIREINLDTQRSTTEIQGIRIIAAASGAVIEQRELFTNILPEDAIIVFEEPSDVEEVAKVFLARIERPERLYPWSEIYNSAGRFTQLHICRFATGQSLPDGSGDGEQEPLHVSVKSVQQFERKATSLWAGHKGALEELVQRAKEGSRVQLYCESPAEIARVSEIIREIAGEVPHHFRLLLGYVHQGFVVESLNTIVVSHHELFGQYALRRRERPARATAPVDTLADLQPGEYVVHASYGVGKYLGIETIESPSGMGLGSPTRQNALGVPFQPMNHRQDADATKKRGQDARDTQGRDALATGKAEYLTIEYADSVKIHVSVQNIALVQKYIGTSPKRPTLSKVGTKKWQKQKEKVAESVRDLAAELLEVQAKRQAIGGNAFEPDSQWQVEFEESFPYQETPDQIGAIGEIKADMQEPVAMDRLLCGDVGYGKTELAMRAAFKAVEGGKQVAVLVPTTVLSVQHERTFCERFADFPIAVEVLNRFKTGRQAKDIVARARKGEVDILIGTHRLLSGDVAFKDLGLLIIDEEQRFGVEHKERLKRMRVNVDILTMTATPIPRTLHMAMLGLRDISSLTTAPLDRRSIVTTVTTYNQDLIRKAIYRELNRQGQVFFLHNRVQSIERKAWEIQKLAPDARVNIAHGQMSKRELEDAMVKFVLGATDVLVCTTIIESGLDIPNANTIFINDADRFGLAELHQLRGRVGRYKHRAYAYMLMPNSRPVSPIAAKRLKAIEEYSHLGAGFRIALRDLEIRGAGNILGPEQSGHIQLVGYQMYCEMLADAVRELKHEKVEPLPSATIDLGVPIYIPKNYIPIDRHRMDAYRKIAVARSPADLGQIEAELADVYGPLPDEARLLLDIGELRIAASKWDIRSVVVQTPSPGITIVSRGPTGDLIFSFKHSGMGLGSPTRKNALGVPFQPMNHRQDADATKKRGRDARDTVKTLFANTRGEVLKPDPKTVRLRLPLSYFEPRTLITFLRRLFAAVSES